MAHYAFIDENNIVIDVITGKDENEGGIDWEQYYAQGRSHFQELKGHTCKRTSYNTKGGVHIHGGVPYRKNYAGIGFTYDAARDAFIPPKPEGNYILNEDSCLWEEVT